MQVIMPSGSWGAVENEDALNTAMRLIALAFGEEGDWASKYGAKFENDVFSMKPDYMDEECSCGGNDRAEAWHAANPHAPECFCEENKRRCDKYDEESGYNAIDAAASAPGMMERGEETVTDDFMGVPLTGTHYWSRRTPAGEKAHKAWCKAHDKRSKAHDRITRELYDERGIKRSRYIWHCDCGQSERREAHFAANPVHLPTCNFEIPNFLFKPSGFRVTWYKYIGRDMEAKGTLPADWLTHVFATHPRGATIEATAKALAEETSHHQETLARIMAEVNRKPDISSTGSEERK